MPTFGEIVDRYMFELLTQETATRLESELKHYYPGEYAITVDETTNVISITPSSDEEATWIALIW